MKDIKVSVIIPAYNAGFTIERCLESILGQDYPNIEIILVDDCSKDDTLDKASRYGIKIISNPINYGVALSRNLGVEHASSDIIIFMDSDIVIKKDGVSRIVKDILTIPSILIVWSKYSEDTQHLNFVSDFKNMDIVYRGTFKREFASYGGSNFMAIKKDVFLSAKGFKARFFVEDIEFSYRVSEGKKKVFLDKNLEVGHIKRYTLFTMLKTDFKRVQGMIDIKKLYPKDNALCTEGITLTSYINIILPLFIIISSAFKAWVCLLLLFGFVINNHGFMRFLAVKRGIIFALKSIGVLFIEYIVIESSILLSFFKGI
jgi:glycosyltransferase involved in cell wall biosynthesis